MNIRALSLHALRVRGSLFVVPLVLLSVAASAHIVKPEEFHPVAEAYRRAVFMLNLNPVLWDQVRTDSGTITAGFSRVDAARAKAYADAVASLIEKVEAEAGISLPTPAMRKQTAQGVFEASTAAVGAIINLHLEAARKQLGDYTTAQRAFEAARQIWAAFEHEVQATDPEQYQHLGIAWLECSGALGAPGIAGVGAVLADSEVFFTESKKIMDYVRINFMDGYVAPAEGTLQPLPTRSATFDAARAVPAKLPPGHNINKQLPRPRQILNMATRGVDESETVLIALGDMAFDSPYIFGEPARSLGISCNTCHNKSITNPNFVIPGLSSVAGGLDVSNSFFAPHANNASFDPLDIPDLRGTRFLAPYGRNGRFASLREFSRNVIVNEFNGPEPDPTMLDGMIAYMLEFDFLPNEHLNPGGTLRASASGAAKRGEVLFNKPFPQMNEMSCASCHRPETHFVDRERHDIGSVSRSEEYALDGALDTPTLLGVKFTPPYFHNGSLPTLRAVTEWFDRQYKLELSENEIADLTAYVECVGDGIEGMEGTMFTLEAEMEEFKFFLSSYEYLRQAGKPELIDALFQTVALEIDAHKWDVQDQSQLPVLDQLAALMEDAYVANQAGDRATADRLVAEYRALFEDNADNLK